LAFLDVSYFCGVFTSVTIQFVVFCFPSPFSALRCRPCFG
jgi:hypothetical protein